MTTRLRSIAALVAVTIAASGCGTMGVNPIVQYLDDTGTTAAIKTRLATENFRSLTGIGVSTRDDVVYLTGSVADDSERQRVETIARRVAGDNRVVSELRVSNAASASVSAESASVPTPAIQK